MSSVYTSLTCHDPGIQYERPKKLAAIASPVRKALRAQFHTLLYRARQRKGLRVFALGQRLRHFADHVAQSAGVANGQRVRRWFQEKLCREKRQGGMEQYQRMYRHPLSLWT